MKEFTQDYDEGTYVFGSKERKKSKKSKKAKR
jgi:hypothetical protein